MIKKVIKFILIVLCMVVIFMFSSDNADMSTEKSDGLIISVCEKVLGRSLTNDEKELYTSKYVKIVRKSAHFTLYFLLGLFIISFLREFIPIDKRSILITIGIVFLYACSDEVHQLFVSGRSCEVLDVIIDTCGGLVSTAIYSLLYRIRRISHE